MLDSQLLRARRDTYAVSPAGTLYLTTFAFPLWAVLVPAGLTFLYASRRVFRQRQTRQRMKEEG